MSLSPRHLIKILEQHNFTYKRSKASHQLYHNSATKKIVIVPIHVGKDIKKSTFLAILKQAGIEKDVSS